MDFSTAISSRLKYDGNVAGERNVALVTRFSLITNKRDDIPDRYALLIMQIDQYRYQAV